MARRGLRPRSGRALGFGAVVAAAVLAATIAHPVSRAQPAPELNRARDLYKSAETAMKDERFDDAARDYGAAYELSKDPALFFKIGRANERAGRCDVALIYYARYVREGKPNEQFLAMTRERIAACGGDARALEGSAAPVEPQPAPPAAGSGSAPDAAGSATAPAGSATPPAAGSATPPAGSTPPPAAGSGSPPPAAGTPPPAGNPAPGVAGSAEPGPGSAADPARPVAVPNRRQQAAWIMTGGAVGLITLGGVLAYAASSSENDVRDLYTELGGQPAVFNAETKEKYEDLIDQGRRFQHLSWAAFGVAGVSAIGAAVLFVLGRDDEARSARIAPVVTTNTAGVVVRF